MLKEKKSILLFLPPKRYEERIKGVGILLILIFSVIIGRYVYIQVFKGEQLKNIAKNQFYYKEYLKDKNYKLFDKDGKEIINYKKKYYAIIDPGFYMKYNMNKKDNNIKKAKYILRDYNKEYNFPDDIDNINYFKKLKYEIDKKTYNKLRELNNIKGFYVYTFNESLLDKNWNIVSLMDNANNFKDSSIKDKGTLERTMQDIRGENKIDSVIVQKGLENFGEKELLKTPEYNLNFRLTLDSKLQKIVENIIRDKKYDNYKDIGIVLMESNTGKILTMVQKYDERPNINIGATSNHGYFPGSIFKIIPAAVGIDKNITWINKNYERNKNIKEYNNLNNMTLRKALICSSNDILYQVAEEVGFKNIYNYSKEFGLLSPVLGLQDEAHGKFEVSDDVKRDEIRHTAIGQKIRITPVEAINIPNVIINKGKIIKPYIIDSIVDDNNKEIKKINSTEKKIIKNSTAKVLENTMVQVVEDKMGTGRLAKVHGVKVGGKTGTSEYFEVKSGVRKKYSDGWFVGFFNLNGKNYSISILVRDIDWRKRADGGKEEDGGTVAAPICKEVIENMREKNY